MQQASFTDLVGAVVEPAHCFDSNELTNLTPSLGTTNAADEMAAQASAAQASYWGGNCS